MIKLHPLNRKSVRWRKNKSSLIRGGVQESYPEGSGNVTITDIKPIPLDKSKRANTEGDARGICNKNAGERLMG